MSATGILLRGGNWDAEDVMTFLMGVRSAEARAVLKRWLEAQQKKEGNQ